MVMGFDQNKTAHHFYLYGDGGARRRLSGAGARGVIVGQMEDFERRHAALRDEASKFTEPDVGPKLIRDRHVE